MTSHRAMHTAIKDREGTTERSMIIAHLLIRPLIQSGQRVRVIPPRAMITSQVDTHTGRVEVSRSKRMEMHTRCIKMKSQRQTGRNLREIGRRMMESMNQKVAKVTLQSMKRRSRNGQKMITSQRTTKKTMSHKTTKIIIHQRTSQRMMITSLNRTKKSIHQRMSQKKKAMIIMAPRGAFGIKSLVVMDVHLVIARDRIAIESDAFEFINSEHI